MSSDVDAINKRFDAVDEALVEQRQYTEFAFERLRSEMREGFTAINGRFDGIDGQLDGMDGRFGRIERKLDQFIDTQSAANRLVERRLAALENKSDHQ